MTVDLDESSLTRGLRGPVIVYFAVAAALGTAAIYPLQPAVAEVARTLATTPASIGAALASGPVGYLLGLAVLVPLVDRFPPRTVLAAQFAGLAAAIAGTAVAAEIWSFGAFVLLTGSCSSVGAGISSVAGRLSDPRRRATVLGMVTAGISSGILAGRIVGGWLADLVGWRPMLLVLALACLVVAGSALLLVPRVGAGLSGRYLATLASIPGLYLRFPTLRLAAVRGAAWFFAFCAIWSGMAVALSGPPHFYSAERIGLYALAGLSGILATRVAGTLTDRYGSRVVILVGLAIAGTAAVGLGPWLGDPVLAVVCLALFDAGLFSAQVANQSTVLAIEPDSPARFNSAYMIVYFVGGSAGTAFGAAAVDWIGWPGTAATAATAIALAAAITLVARKSGALV